ncbi:MAG: hypothetical protein Q9207_006855 [Kuettlingeria erythrocarpa]
MAQAVAALDVSTSFLDLQCDDDTAIPWDHSVVESMMDLSEYGEGWGTYSSPVRLTATDSNGEGDKPSGLNSAVAISISAGNHTKSDASGLADQTDRLPSVTEASVSEEEGGPSGSEPTLTRQVRMLDDHATVDVDGEPTKHLASPARETFSSDGGPRESQKPISDRAAPLTACQPKVLIVQRAEATSSTAANLCRTSSGEKVASHEAVQTSACGRSSPEDELSQALIGPVSRKRKCKGIVLMESREV